MRTITSQIYEIIHIDITELHCQLDNFLGDGAFAKSPPKKYPFSPYGVQSAPKMQFLVVELDIHFLGKDPTWDMHMTSVKHGTLVTPPAYNLYTQEHQTLTINHEIVNWLKWTFRSFFSGFLLSPVSGTQRRAWSAGVPCAVQCECVTPSRAVL